MYRYLPTVLGIALALSTLPASILAQPLTTPSPPVPTQVSSSGSILPPTLTSSGPNLVPTWTSTSCVAKASVYSTEGAASPTLGVALYLVDDNLLLGTASDPYIQQPLPWQGPNVEESNWFDYGLESQITSNKGHQAQIAWKYAAWGSWDQKFDLSPTATMSGSTLIAAIASSTAFPCAIDFYTTTK